MIQYPGFDKIAFEIGPFGSFGPLKVHWYGIMYLVAFSVGWFLARMRAKKPGSTWKPADVDDFMFFCMLGTIIGGRLGYVFFYGMSFWAQDAWYPLKVMDGGMSFHGGLIGVLVALAKVCVALREVTIAWRYGVDAVVDAYQVALTLTTWLPLLIAGITTSVLVPRLVAVRREPLRAIRSTTMASPRFSRAPPRGPEAWMWRP